MRVCEVCTTTRSNIGNRSPKVVTAQHKEDFDTAERRALADKLDTAGWGLFFIWIGIAFLANVGIGTGLLGVGIIILAEQLTRKLFKLRLEGFWVVAGLAFAVGGMWELFDVKLPLVPILLIVAGIVLLASVISGKHLLNKKRH